MMRAILFITIILVSFHVSAQVSPRESAELNYRIIGFSAPDFKTGERYLLEIAEGVQETDASFEQHIIKTERSQSACTIAEVPYFNSRYTWRVRKAMGNRKEQTVLHHFSVGGIAETDTNKFRLRNMVPAQRYKDGYVFLDGTRTLYDMAGRPIWYMPTTISRDMVVRDLKITPQGTITFVIDERGVYEINYDGDILWQGPNNGAVSGDEVEHYHHEFTRASNGHYFALAQNFMYWEPASANDSIVHYLTPSDAIKSGKVGNYERTPMGTIIEYDDQGRVVWSWKSSDHFKGTDLFYRSNKGQGRQMHAHENSFFFDEQHKCIYVSMRNLSRIVKIKYPEGSILNIYGGDAEKPGIARLGDGYFCGQHSCRISDSGFLYCYNNNACAPGKLPSIVLLQEPSGPEGSMKKIWEYFCTVESYTGGVFPSGGNVLEMPDHSYFVSMAYPDSKVFIVNRKMDILWSAVAEKQDEAKHLWEPINLYRGSIINDRKTLERLILNSKGK